MSFPENNERSQQELSKSVINNLYMTKILRYLTDKMTKELGLFNIIHCREDLLTFASATKKTK